MMDPTLQDVETDLALPEHDQLTDIHDVVAKHILQSNKKIYIASTGAGAGIQKSLWSIPGVSNALVGASFPYSKEALQDFLGFEPEQYCSEDTAIDLAQQAYMQAWTPGSDAIGIGLTGSVSSLKPHRGEHRVHAAYFTKSFCEVFTIVLKKFDPELTHANTARYVDGRISDDLGLIALASAAEWEPELVDKFAAEHRVASRASNEKAHKRFFAHPWFMPDGKRIAMPDKFEEGLSLYPGSFNPPHEGHFGIHRKMQSMTSRPIFEVTTDPLHKPAIRTSALLQRAVMLKGYERMFTRGCPKYIDKAELFPKVNLILGADSMIRIFDKRWTSNPNVLGAEFKEAGTTFYVFGRLIDGVYTDLRDISAQCLIPTRIKTIVVDGRWDVSSSEIRAKQEEVTESDD